MNETRQGAVETVNFRLYFKVIIRQDDDFEIVENLQSQLLALFHSYFELQDDFILRILFLFITKHSNS